MFIEYRPSLQKISYNARAFPNICFILVLQNQAV